MATYKQGIDFLPKQSKAEVEEESRLSRTSIYAAVLPLLAAVIWVISGLINLSYKSELKTVKGKILGAEKTIETYNPLRELQTEVYKKVELLSTIIGRDFYPQELFNKVDDTIEETTGASSSIYGYKRDSEGMFTVSGRAQSYMDLAKIMVVFRQQEEFNGVRIKSIFYNIDEDYVNFEINFFYFKEDVNQQ